MRHRTGAGARINPDHINMQRLVVLGVLVAFAASVLTSWNGLVAVAAWQHLAPEWRWLTPLMIDVPIVILTLAGLILRARQESTVLVDIGAFGLTTISSAANFLHTVSLGGLGTFEAWAGACINALAPFLVLMSTEVLGGLITRSRRADREARAKERAKAKAVKARRAPTKKPEGTTWAFPRS